MKLGTFYGTATTAVIAAVLSGCGSDPAPEPATPPSVAASSATPAIANPCSLGEDMGCGTPDAACATNRLGKQFALDGVVYTCRAPKPYAWRRGE